MSSQRIMRPIVSFFYFWKFSPNFVLPTFKINKNSLKICKNARKAEQKQGFL